MTYHYHSNSFFFGAFLGAWISDQYHTRPIIQATIDPQFYYLKNPAKAHSCYLPINITIRNYSLRPIEYLSVTYVLERIPHFDQTIRLHYLPPGEHKITLSIEFDDVKNGTQLDVLITFKKNLNIFGEELPRNYDQCIFEMYDAPPIGISYTLICYIKPSK